MDNFRQYIKEAHLKDDDGYEFELNITESDESENIKLEIKESTDSEEIYKRNLEIVKNLISVLRNKSEAHGFSDAVETDRL